MNCQTKVHFPLKQNGISTVEKCFHQPRYKNKTKQNKQKKQLRELLIIAHFWEDQTKYQSSQTLIYIYVKIHAQKSQQLDEISETSAVYTVVCQIPGKYSLKKLGESTCWKK